MVVFAIALLLTTSTLAPLNFGAEDGDLDLDLAFNVDTGGLSS